MSFDLSRALRRLKPAKQYGPLKRREDSDLEFVLSAPVVGPEILLDTTVYIDILQGRAPNELKGLIGARVNNHSAVALGELIVAYGTLDQSDPRTASVLAAYDKTIAGIRPHRLSAPSVSAIAEAGILSGMLARLKPLPKEKRPSLFNDAVIFLQALEEGRTVVTRNIGDFDMLQQLVPSGRVLFYRQRP